MKKKAIQPLKKSTKGSLHKALHVPNDEKIPLAKIRKAKNSPSAALRKKATFALNAKNWKHGKKATRKSPRR